MATTAGRVHVVASDVDDGDFHLERVTPDAIERRRRRLVDRPWTMALEQHGTGVVHVTGPGVGDREPGDVVVTDRSDVALGVWAGDCAPLVLVHDAGPFAVVHAGWRGLAAGVIDVACDALALGATVGGAAPTARAFLGPTIGPCCYEFGAADLGVVADAVGAPTRAVASTTRWGAPSLDVPSAITAGLRRRGVPTAGRPACTGCGQRHFSHRVRGDLGRHVVVAWRTT